MDMGMEVMGMMSMSPGGSSSVVAVAASEDEGDLRRGPWTVEEDVLLVDYIADHGEGRWNSLARCAGLRRTGKSCRLRWLNYLRPDVRRGNITPEEQLLILDLHSRWGNRWSKIAQHLPGRSDNEIKNYWRTKVQKHAKQLKCDVNSNQFRDLVRCIWMPRLVERIHAAAAGSSASVAGDDGAVMAVTMPPVVTRTMSSPIMPCKANHHHSEPSHQTVITMSPDDASSMLRPSLTTDVAQFATSSGHTDVGDQAYGGERRPSAGDDVISGDVLSGSWSELLATTGREATATTVAGLPDFEFGDFEDNLWSLDDIWLQQQQQYC